MSHKTNFEEFCTKAVARLIDVEPDKIVPDNKNLGFDFLAILEVIEKLAPVILAFMSACPKKDNFAAAVKNSTWGQRVAFRWQIRQLDTDDNTILRRKSAKLADSVMLEAMLTDDAVLNQIAEEISSVDNLLI